MTSSDFSINGPMGCVWNRAQTGVSSAPYTMPGPLPAAVSPWKTGPNLAPSAAAPLLGGLTAPQVAPACTASAPWKRWYSPQAAVVALLPQVYASTPVEDERQGVEAALARFAAAYGNFLAVRGDEVNEYALLVNFGVESTWLDRAYLFNMRTLQLVRGPMRVAHGKPSGAISERGYRARYGSSRSFFSNRPNTNRSSLGLYTVYAFPHGARTHDGKWNDEPYQAPRVGLEGQSRGFNDQARVRGIYMHGIPTAGTTEGCLGFDYRHATRGRDGIRQTDMRAVMRYLQPKKRDEPGGVVWVDAPVQDWIEGDPWLAPPRAATAPTEPEPRARPQGSRK